jgi:excinuclease UvrABC nuclease subunit
LAPLRIVILDQVKALHQAAPQRLTPIKSRKDLGDITSRCGIYLIYERDAARSQGWQLVYIGTEKRVRLRVSQHLFYPLDSTTKHKGYRVEDNAHLDYGVLWQEVMPVEVREYVEHVLIEHFKPRDNLHS